MKKILFVLLVAGLAPVFSYGSNSDPKSTPVQQGLVYERAALAAEAITELNQCQAVLVKNQNIKRLARKLLNVKQFYNKADYFERLAKALVEKVGTPNSQSLAKSLIAVMYLYDNSRYSPITPKAITRWAKRYINTTVDEFLDVPVPVDYLVAYKKMMGVSAELKTCSAQCKQQRVKFSMVDTYSKPVVTTARTAAAAFKQLIDICNAYPDELPGREFSPLKVVIDQRTLATAQNACF